jgi:hypothetical protein
VTSGPDIDCAAGRDAEALRRDNDYVPTHPVRISVETGYVLAAGGLAVAGAITQQPQYYLAAVLLTLPLGLAAVAGIYVGYALIQALGGLVAATTTSGGDQPAWLSTSSAALNIALFVAAAAGNVVLLRRITTSKPPAVARFGPPEGRFRA